ncbi:tetratricopeptide repeat protein [Myxococcaceae bacterium GXIMD 01537]
MTPAARAELEARAERCLRRGELDEALAHFETLVREFPEDAALTARLVQLRDTLQPLELQNVKARFLAEHAPLGPASPMQEGERLFSLGDYAGAAAAYRRALQERPDNQLIQERLVELFQLARNAPRAASPTDKALPLEPLPRLNALLDRVAARRRLKR